MQAKTFNIIWLGQLLSGVATTLLGFSLGIWIFEITGSITNFALISLCTYLPSILISGVAGKWVDKYDKKLIMVWSLVILTINIFTLTVLILNSLVGVALVYCFIIIGSTVNTFQWCAYQATIPLFWEKQHEIVKANGKVQAAQAISYLIAPLFGGISLEYLNIFGTLCIVFISYSFAFLTLLRVTVPKRRDSREKKTDQSLKVVFIYMLRKKGIAALLFFFVINFFLNGILNVLATPLILGLTSKEMLGVILSIGGVGMISGSILISKWGGPSKLVHGILIPTILSGLLIVIVGIKSSLIVITVCSFGVFFFIPLIRGVGFSLLQNSLPPEFQGRGIALARAISLSALPIAYLVAGPAVEIFSPYVLSLLESYNFALWQNVHSEINFFLFILGIFTMILGLSGYGLFKLHKIQFKVDSNQRAS